MRRQFDYFSIQHIYRCAFFKVELERRIGSLPDLHFPDHCRESNSTADAISNEAIDTGGWPGLKDRQVLSSTEHNSSRAMLFRDPTDDIELL